MFDALLKSKFYSKCKTAIKITKTRIEMIKRKRSAMEKFLKKDIVDLLKNGLDFNAYGRAEGLLIELNMSACYNFVGEFCACLYKQVSSMDKQRDCPGEYREAVSSLMYAAARFADLPELRELRAIFLEKYGNSLEANINQEFVTRLKAMPPTKDMKIQLLQDIALESGKSWDSKALEQKLYIPPSSEQGLSEDTNDVNQSLLKLKEELVNRINKKDTENKRRNLSVPSSPRNLNDLPSYKTIKNNVDKYKLQEHKNTAIHAEDTEKVDESKPFQSKFSPPPPYHRRSSSEVKNEQLANKNMVHEGDFENRPNQDIQRKSLNENENQNRLRSGNNGHGGKHEEIEYYQRKFAPVSYRRRKFSWDQGEDLAIENSEKTSDKDVKNKSNPEINEHEGKSDEKQHFQSKFAHPAPYMGPKAEKSVVEEKTQQPDDTNKAKPKPKSVRSVRSRRSIIPPEEVNIVKNDDILNAIRKELATKPGHISIYKNDDETDIDEVLMHYCKRDSPRSGKGTSARASFGSELTITRDKKIDSGSSSSYQPDTKSVHSKLPTYDDFVTKVAYLSRD